jgi:very-short-patch-repair endonuclease
MDARLWLVVHRSRTLERSRHPVLLPPRTRVEDTLLDLAEAAGSLDEAVRWLSMGCGARLTTAGRLQRAAETRARLRRRADLNMALVDVGDGVHSVLEYRYVRDVERRHRLPRAARQARSAVAGRSQYRDNLYAEFGVCVELDGRAAHPDHRRWADQRRDNAAAGQGIITIRYSWAEVRYRPCRTAAEVAAVLRSRGWPGLPRACGPGCAAAPPRS